MVTKETPPEYSLTASAIGVEVPWGFTPIAAKEAKRRPERRQPSWP